MNLKQILAWSFLTACALTCIIVTVSYFTEDTVRYQQVNADIHITQPGTKTVVFVPGPGRIILPSGDTIQNFETEGILFQGSEGQNNGSTNLTIRLHHKLRIYSNSYTYELATQDCPASFSEGDTGYVIYPSCTVKITTTAAPTTTTTSPVTINNPVVLTKESLQRNECKTFSNTPIYKVCFNFGTFEERVDIGEEGRTPDYNSLEITTPYGIAHMALSVDEALHQTEKTISSGPAQVSVQTNNPQCALREHKDSKTNILLSNRMLWLCDSIGFTFHYTDPGGQTAGPLLLLDE